MSFNLIHISRPDTFSFSLRTPHLILAGLGASERLGQEAKAIGAKKGLVVTDKGVIDSGIGKKIKGLLEKEGIGIEGCMRVEYCSKAIFL